MKNVLKNMLTLTSLGSSAESPLFEVGQLYCIAIHYTTTGTPAGTLTIQGSCDIIDPANGGAPTNWATIGSAVTLSAAGSTLVNIDGIGFPWLRVIFTASAGTGTLVVNLSAKG